ncbi:2-C-methyl-D-erythritol 4-phosphate cytidylyltransferase [Jeotgalibacillus sp. R-1-5s-1]|uniref:2-C-methyl-D-erythritol 4-phosphate cytidylyltransferase n=1 Tax=Jeotgalibacillus sp. R-1-5s-1 TaxID=2555897 RepID=UPI001069BFB2|nr:2-C-methyl-D-erythritol 4-phosphate cytidylyltransferase [Jeotgalibacillus sp. R-1-5s-1]TFD99317.1 2-C-methyl-D-erythritol 4-phosphate cytidylyltransferase [Jeotgalibacillus sp. R-1-5s-1]
MNYEVVIPAAGQGKRMGADRNKLLLTVKEVPVIIHTLRVFEADEACDGILLAIHPDDREELTRLLAEYNITKVKAMVPGGKERQNSVYEALKQAGADIVMIHDGARPFIKKETIHSLAKKAQVSDGAIAAVPVKDTIKKVMGGTVTETVERASLWSVQTPQAFRLDLILQAHKAAEEEGFTGTDDASLVEKMGGKVTVIESDYDNIKLTTKEDLLFAEAILTKMAAARNE